MRSALADLVRAAAVALAAVAALAQPLAAEPHNHALRQDAPPALTGAAVVLETRQGERVAAYAAGPADAAAGLVVFHEMWGLTDFVRAEADRLGGLGLRVIAVDLYRGRIGADSRAAYRLMEGVDEGYARRVADAALAWLDAPQRKVGALGWCFGGEQALAAALAHPERVSATVIYYGRPELRAGRLERLRGPVLGLFATEDSWVPKRDVERFARAMARAGRTLDLRWFPAGHAFANPSGAHHDAAQAAAARAASDAFLLEQLLGRPDERRTL